jgi:acyl CoA:acetate/3-ketoacid CoA transferase alpha subunit
MTVPAAWTQAGYKRPDWGAVPPQVGATVAVGKQQVEVKAHGVAQQQTIAPDVKLAQLQPADTGTGEGDATGEAAEKYAVHELAGVVPGLSIADAVASLYDWL